MEKNIAVIQFYSPLGECWYDREIEFDVVAEMTNEQLIEKVKELNAPNPSRCWRGIRRKIIDTKICGW